MTNHPTEPTPPASPDIRVPDLREVIRQATEEILLAAKRTRAHRDQLTREAAYDIAGDREDDRTIAEAIRAVEEAERALDEARAHQNQRRARMTERSAAIRALDAQLARLEEQGRQGTALYEQYGQNDGSPTETLVDGLAEVSGGAS